MRFGAHKRVDDTLTDWFELIVEEHQRDPFDIIHAYFLTQAGFVAAYAGRYLNIPSVVSIRGNDIERAPFDPAKFSHSMYALQNANAVTANASQLATKAIAFVKREIKLIPNGIDTDLFKKMARNDILQKTLGIDPSVPVIGFAGELRAKKGMKTILNAYAQISIRHPVNLLIVGEVRPRDDRKAFEEFCLETPKANIIVTGNIPHKELPAYYALMDVFLHPSLRDGMPNAVLEAMACELPVIATPVGGILDVLKNRSNGIIVPINDSESIVTMLEEVFANEELRAKLGKAARDKIVQEFTLEKEISANLILHKQILRAFKHG